MADRVVHVLGVPEHEDVEREAERGELVWLHVVPFGEVNLDTASRLSIGRTARED